MVIFGRGLCNRFFVLLCTVLLISSDVPLTAQETQKVPNDQLDSLVAPIALYPDPLLAQVLAASTYPLEIIQLQQFLNKNKDLKDKALTDAVMQQPWDPSVQALAPLPDVVKRLADDIQWTTDLGNAFLAQESDVMDAVQRMRIKAKQTGNLKSTDQMKVETQVVESKSVIVIQQANPQVVYVPSYNPTVVYGPPVYPYPPIYYPPPGYYAAGMAISFGVGLAVGAAWGGGWGWGCGWGHSNVNININNTYISNYNRTNVNNKIGGNGTWQHNPQHRGGTPYADRNTANRYGGTARGESMGNRQAQARQNQGQLGNRQQGSASNVGANRAGAGGTGQPGGGNRASGSANRAGASGTGQPAVGNRASSGASNVGANRAGGGGAGAGGDRVGNRSVSPNAPTGSKSNAFGGASSGTGGSGARESSARGASSMAGAGGARGGGAAGGGGGRRR